jgi:hypothetical protein
MGTANKSDPEFPVGSRVRFLDEAGGGVVKAYRGALIIVEMDNGIEIPYSRNKLVVSGPLDPVISSKKAKKPPKPPKPPKPGDNLAGSSEIAGHNHNSDVDWSQIKPGFRKVRDPNFKVSPMITGDAPERRKRKLPSAPDPIPLIDLHIQELLEDYGHLTNSQILRIQVNHLQKFLRQAMQRKSSRIIIIHGVGKGVLKEAVCEELDKLDNAQYFDASYRDYGKGATEVRLSY